MILGANGPMAVEELVEDVVEELSLTPTPVEEVVLEVEAVASSTFADTIISYAQEYWWVLLILILIVLGYWFYRQYLK